MCARKLGNRLEFIEHLCTSLSCLQNKFFFYNHVSPFATVCHYIASMNRGTGVGIMEVMGAVSLQEVGEMRLGQEKWEKKVQELHNLLQFKN